LTSDADSNSRSARAANSPSPAPGDSLSGCSGGLSISAERDALFLDVDGTLLQIARHPDAVRVPADLLAALDRLHGRFGGALALISGRAIDNLDALFAPLRLPCAGVHGLERRGADAAVHRDDAAAVLAPLRAPIEDFVARHDGLLLEDKGQSLALHFRNAPACAARSSGDTSGNARLRHSNRSTSRRLTIIRVTHLWSAGITYHGAQAVLVAPSAASYASR